MCVCVLLDSGRQTELEPAARHTQHTPPLDELHAALRMEVLLVWRECAVLFLSFLLSVTHAELRDKTAFESEAGFTVPCLSVSR